MTKPSQDTIVDEILSEMPLEARVSLASMEKKEVEVLQGVFDLYIRSRVDPEDEEYENIMQELWEKSPRDSFDEGCEMKIEVPIDDCKMLKKYAHAEICFMSCVDYLDIYIDEKVKWNSSKARGLLSAFIIEYAKPFKRSFGVDPINEKIIPDEHKQLHDLIIRSRDKYIAHIDDQDLEPDREFHRIHFLKRMNKIDIDVESPRFPPDAIEPMKQLALDLKKKAAYHKQKYIDKYGKIMFRHKGDIAWELVIEKNFSGFKPVPENDLTKTAWE